MCLNLISGFCIKSSQLKNQEGFKTDASFFAIPASAFPSSPHHQFPPCPIGGRSLGVSSPVAAYAVLLTQLTHWGPTQRILPDPPNTVPRAVPSQPLQLQHHETGWRTNQIKDIALLEDRKEKVCVWQPWREGKKSRWFGAFSQFV